MNYGKIAFERWSRMMAPADAAAMPEWDDLGENARMAWTQASWDAINAFLQQAEEP